MPNPALTTQQQPANSKVLNGIGDEEFFAALPLGPVWLCGGSGFEEEQSRSPVSPLIPPMMSWCDDRGCWPTPSERAS